MVDDRKSDGVECIADVADVDIISSVVPQQSSTAQSAWVRCDDCYKWRRIPVALANSIDENCRWYFFFLTISVYLFIYYFFGSELSCQIVITVCLKTYYFFELLSLLYIIDLSCPPRNAVFWAPKLYQLCDSFLRLTVLFLRLTVVYNGSHIVYSMLDDWNFCTDASLISRSCIYLFLLCCVIEKFLWL